MTDLNPQWRFQVLPEDSYPLSWWRVTLILRHRRHVVTSIFRSKEDFDVCTTKIAKASESCRHASVSRSRINLSSICHCKRALSTCMTNWLCRRASVSTSCIDFDSLGAQALYYFTFICVYKSCDYRVRIGSWQKQILTARGIVCLLTRLRIRVLFFSPFDWHCMYVLKPGFLASL